MSALLSIEVVEVGGMLEVVCIAGAVLNNGIGNYIVVEHLNFKGDILLGEDMLCDLKNLCVRSGGGCNGNGSALQSCVVNAAVEAVSCAVNGGNNAAFILLVNEICDLLALKSCLESLYRVGSYSAGLYGENVFLR